MKHICEVCGKEYNNTMLLQSIYGVVGNRTCKKCYFKDRPVSAISRCYLKEVGQSRKRATYT